MNSGINAGVMLLEPSAQIYQRMISEINDPQHPEHVGTYGPEQDYLSRFYSTFVDGRWTHLHPKFNYQLGLGANYASSTYHEVDIREDGDVARYSGGRVKPWKLDAGCGREEMQRVLEDDSVCKQGNHQTRRPAQSSDRSTDGMAAQEKAAELMVMWEWVLALRSCAAELREEAGVNILAVV